MSSGGVLEYSRGCWNSQLSGPSVSNAYTSCCSRSGEYTMNLTPRDQSFKWIVGGIVVIGFMAGKYHPPLNGSFGSFETSSVGM